MTNLLEKWGIGLGGISLLIGLVSVGVSISGPMDIFTRLIVFLLGLIIIFGGLYWLIRCIKKRELETNETKLIIILRSRAFWIFLPFLLNIIIGYLFLFSTKDIDWVPFMVIYLPYFLPVAFISIFRIENDALGLSVLFLFYAGFTLFLIKIKLMDTKKLLLLSSLTFLIMVISIFKIFSSLH